MAPPKGNRFWEKRSSHGRKPLFNSPEELWNAAVEYFEWVEDNPLEEEKVFHAQGIITKTTVTKMRAMTVQGLCLYLDIDEQTLANYEKKEDFFGIVKQIKSVIYEQKFTGAAADLLNPNIISRDLGLSDSQAVKHSGSVGNVNYDVKSDDPKEAAQEYLEMLKNG